jgi:hypothetical protein
MAGNGMAVVKNLSLDFTANHSYEDRLVRESFLIDQVVDSNLYNLRLFLRQ